MRRAEANAGDEDRVAAHLRALATTALRAAESLSGDVASAARLTHAALDRGGKILFCGNGGSAADAQHLATEYMVRFRRTGLPMRALALTTDSSLLTAAANDLGFEHVFARQVLALGDAGDVLFLHSTSGESSNLVEAARVAGEGGLTRIGVLARGGGRLRDHVDCAIVVPGEDGAHAQELHIAIGHAICDLVESRLRRDA